MTTDQDTRQKITAELYAALERLGADDELLAIVGSMQDTMTVASLVGRPGMGDGASPGRRCPA